MTKHTLTPRKLKQFKLSDISRQQLHDLSIKMTCSEAQIVEKAVAEYHDKHSKKEETK